MLWGCYRVECKGTQALSTGIEMARQGFGATPTLPVPVSYHPAALHFISKAVLFIPPALCENIILAKIHLCHKTFELNQATCVTELTGKQYRRLIYGVGQMWMYLVSKLTIYTEHFLQHVCLSHEVWLWSSNPLGTSKILGTTKAPSSLLCLSTSTKQ